MVNAEKFWDRAAPKYAQSKIKDMDSYQYTLKRTRSYLEPTDIALEIGAGTGSTALLLSDAVNQMIATDISDKMLDVGRENAKEQGITNVSFVHRAANQIDAGPYDVILAHNILHLVEDLPETLRCAYDALKAGGYLITKTFVRPTKGINLVYQLMRIALPVMQRLGKAPFVEIYALAEFEAMFEQAGFEIVETANYPATEPRRYIVARKS